MKRKRNPKPRAAGPKIDRRRRAPCAALDASDRRDLRAAFAHGQRIDRAPTCTIDFHPAYMDQYPVGELSVWFKDELRNRITTWLRRRGVGWYAIWVRENYAGNRREHLHLLIHCPIALRADLEAAIRRWYPGRPEMVKLGQVTWRKDPRTSYMTCVGLEYRLKQMTARAWGPPRPGRPRREIKNRHDGAPVAPVLGSRYGISTTLNQKARDEWATARLIFEIEQRRAHHDLAEQAA